MKLAYADPPYLGCCHRYGHRHEDPWGCWDDPAEHGKLIAQLDAEYDGWAYSLTSPSLQKILPLAPKGVRVGAWTKTWSSFKTANPAYAWEPVIFKSSRTWAERGGRGVPTIRDWVAERVTTGQPVIGAKPDRFCRWVLDLIGYTDGDTMDDLFPGSGIMGRVEAQGTLA